MAENKFTKIVDYLTGAYDLRFNEITNDLETRKKGSKTKFDTANESTLAVELYKQGYTGFDSMLTAFFKSDLVEKHNPIFEYFENLEAWDGQTDYIQNLANFVQVEDHKWFSQQFKKMLVRVVACGLKEIPFNKHCFTFVGKQNDGKTTFFRWLCPKELRQDHYTEDIDFTSKDGKISLATNLFINLDELSNLAKTEIDTVKNFISQESIKLRRPFDKKDTFAPRISSFFASTNNGRFLTDDTGSVRWLVFEINGINHDNGGVKGYQKNVDIDKIWSQAYALLKQGFKYVLTQSEIDEINNRNKVHQKTTPEMEILDQYYQPCNEDCKTKMVMTSTQVLQVLQNRTENKIKMNSVNVGKALNFLGFKKEDKRGVVIDGKIRYYPVSCYLLEDKKI